MQLRLLLLIEYQEVGCLIAAELDSVKMSLHRICGLVLSGGPTFLQTP